MIDSLRELRAWVGRDLERYDRRPADTLLREPQVRWQIKLRLAEYLVNRYGGALGALARWRLQAASVRLGYTIPPNVFGPGLKLPHWGTIVVSSDARVGAGCTLHPNTVLATRAGAPHIGDGVTICAGAFVEGPIRVGDRATIAPNAVVRHPVPDGDVVGGVPARSLHPERSVAAGD